MQVDWGADGLPSMPSANDPAVAGEEWPRYVDGERVGENRPSTGVWLGFYMSAPGRGTCRPNLPPPPEAPDNRAPEFPAWGPAILELPQPRTQPKWWHFRAWPEAPLGGVPEVWLVPQWTPGGHGKEDPEALMMMWEEGGSVRYCWYLPSAMEGEADMMRPFLHESEAAWGPVLVP